MVLTKNKMPYSIRKAPNQNLYWVVGENGKKHSILPIPRERAEAQRRALYAVEHGYVLDRSRYSRKRSIGSRSRSRYRQKSKRSNSKSRRSRGY